MLAAIVLTHPAHLPAALAILAAAAVVRSSPRRALVHAAAATGVALALVGFWLLPLLVRVEHTRALAWGTLALPSLLRPFTLVVAALVLVALAGRASPAPRALLHAVWLAGAAVAVDALVLESLGVRFLPADRVADGACMIVLLAAGLGAGVVGASASRHVAAPIASLGLVLVLIVFALPTRSLTLWPRAADWPSLHEVERGLRLDELARALRQAPPGRVLFIRSGVPLVFGTEWYRPHTHVTALTPVLTGRDIIGGTFTHGAPVAALVYRGDAGRAPIDRLAEHLDGVSLFGRPLDALDPQTFDDHARRFRVAAVVALEDDAPHLPFVADRARYRRVEAPPFLVFIATDAPPSLRRASPRTWQAQVSGERGTWASTGIAYYPLWRAESEGKRLAVRRGAAGDLEVRLEDSTDAKPGPGARALEVRLTYAAATPEMTGATLSAVTLLTLLADAWRRRRSASRSPSS